MSTLKTSRVYRHLAHITTCARDAGIHGDVLNGHTEKERVVAIHGFLLVNLSGANDHPTWVQLLGEQNCALRNLRMSRTTRSRLFTTPARFCTPREHWRPHPEGRRNRQSVVKTTIHTCAQLSLHFRLYACEPRPIVLHFSRPRPSHSLLKHFFFTP